MRTLSLMPPEPARDPDRRYDLSIVLPRAFERAEQIRASLSRIDAFAAATGLRIETIVVDDSGLGDIRAADLAAADGVVLLANPRNRGKGYSVRRGVLRSTGALVAFMDSDLPVDLVSLGEAVALVRSGVAEVAIGNRYAPETVTLGAAVTRRRRASRIFRRFARIAALKDVDDFQCPLKLMTREAAHAVFSLQRLDSFAFDAEVLFLLKRLNFRVHQLPVTWRDARAPWSMGETSRVLLKMMLDLCVARIWWALRPPRRSAPADDLAHPGTSPWI